MVYTEPNVVMIAVRVTYPYSTTSAFALLPPYKLIYNVVNKIHRISIMLSRPLSNRISREHTNSRHYISYGIHRLYI